MTFGRMAGPRRSRRTTERVKHEAKKATVEKLKAKMMTCPEKLEANGASPDERADEARFEYLLS